MTAGPRWAVARALVRRVARGWSSQRLFLLASALTFDALAATLPFLILVLTILGLLVPLWVPSGQIDLRALLQGLFPTSGPVELSPLIRVEDLLKNLVERRTSLSVLGIPLLLVFSARLFATVRTVLNEIFQCAETRSWLVRRGVEFLLVAIVGTFLLVNTVTSVAVGIITTVAGGFVSARVAAGAITFASALGLFAIIYRIAPARRINWSTALVAGSSCALFFEIAKRAFGAYLSVAIRFESLTPDIQLASAMLLLAWLYVTVLVFLTAAQVTNTTVLLDEVDDKG